MFLSLQELMEVFEYFRGPYGATLLLLKSTYSEKKEIVDHEISGRKIWKSKKSTSKAVRFSNIKNFKEI